MSGKGLSFQAVRLAQAVFPLSQTRLKGDGFIPGWVSSHPGNSTGVRFDFKVQLCGRGREVCRRLVCWLQQDKRIKGFCEPKEL